MLILLNEGLVSCCQAKPPPAPADPGRFFSFDSPSFDLPKQPAVPWPCRPHWRWNVHTATIVIPNRQIIYRVWLEMGGLVHPQLGLLCGPALPGAFCYRKTWLLRKSMIFNMLLKWLFMKIYLIRYSLEEPLSKPASWPLYNFCGCPKSLKWSFQSRPMTDVFGNSRLETLKQPTFLTSLNYNG